MIAVAYHSLLALATGDPARAELAQIVQQNGGNAMTVTVRWTNRADGKHATELDIWDLALVHKLHPRWGLDESGGDVIHITGRMGRLIAFAKQLMGVGVE